MNKRTFIQIIQLIAVVGAIVVASIVLLNNEFKNKRNSNNVTYEYDTIVNAKSMQLYDEKDTIYAFIVSETGENYLIKVEK